MNDVPCSGGESHLYDCTHRRRGNSNCSHSQDASVKCSPVRLINGGTNYGRVEVSLNGIWSTVCDDYWDINDANVVGRQLGFSSASSAPQGAPYGWDQVISGWKMSSVKEQKPRFSTVATYLYRLQITGFSHSQNADVVCVS